VTDLGFRLPSRIVFQDFVSTVLLAFFWLVASCVWARGASGVSDAVDDIFQEFKTSQNCSVSFVECTSDKPTYGGIIVAVVRSSCGMQINIQTPYQLFVLSVREMLTIVDPLPSN
jgi:hypothetical protein